MIVELLLCQLVAYGGGKSANLSVKGGTVCRAKDINAAFECPEETLHRVSKVPWEVVLPGMMASEVGGVVRPD